MRFSLLVSLVLIASASASSGCVKMGLTPQDFPLPTVSRAHVPAKLRVSVEEQGYEPAALQQFVAMRLADLLSEGNLFSDAGYGLQNSDVKLETVLHFSETFRMEVMMLMCAFPIDLLYLPFVLFGAPGSGMDSSVTIQVVAKLTSTDEVLMDWTSTSVKVGYGGIYYHQWPTGKAALSAMTDMISRISRDTLRLERAVKAKQGYAQSPL